MDWLRRIVQDSRFIFFISVVAGFLFPGTALLFEPSLLWIGTVLMTATLLDVDIGEFHDYKWRSILSLLALNYGLLSVAYLIAASLFAPPYQYGLLFLALMPPSIGVISLTNILRGDVNVSFYAECVAYAVSLITIPLAVLIFLGDTVSVIPVLRVLFFLLVLPVGISQGLRRLFDQRFSSIHGWVKPVFNACYGASFFIVIGVNAAQLLDNPILVAWLALTLLVVKTTLSSVTHYALRHRLRRAIDIDAVLFASFKNGGMAVIFVLTVLGVEASLPLAVNSFLAPFHIVYLEYWLLPALR